MNFSTRNETWRKLMSNGLTYEVPRFQRDYSWNEEQWEDLWQDILATVRGDAPAHYLGYLVLRSEDERHFEIIDGQQRLTTLSVLVIAGLRQLTGLRAAAGDPTSVDRRLETLRQGYLGYEDPVTLVSEPKLKLNRNNDAYYRNHLLPLSDPLPRYGFRASEHLLRRACEWFESRLGAYLDGEPDPGKAIAALVDRMSDRLFFTVITVTDELNAYTVFETLNARGVRLSATDLLKNYLFARLHGAGRHETEMKALEERWDRIVDRVGEGSLPDFARTHWISRRPLVRRSDLFKAMRQEIRDARAVFALLEGMEGDLDIWLALMKPDTYATEWTAEPRRDAALLRMFGVRQPLPLLLAAHRRVPREAFDRLLRAIVVLSFRYNVIGNGQTNEQERAYSAEAQRIERREHRTLADILPGLSSVYPGDEEFRNAFSTKVLGTRQSRNLRIARYLLSELEHQESGARPDYDDPSISVEHVCPVAGGEGWGHIPDPDLDSMTQRLGNLVLLSRGQNRTLGSADYATKQAAYRESGFRTTIRLAQDHDAWTPDAIAARQRAMARTATAVWRIPQLD